MSNSQVELNQLRGLSARLGRDPLLVQASSGNTSLKQGGVLWIKASGKWLLQADDEDFLVPIRLSDVRSSLRRGEDATRQDPHPGWRRASIETAMHSVLPQPVVVHVHSVNAIAWGVREDGRERLGPLLMGLPWSWIPYTASGISLAGEIEKALCEAPETDVFVLGNHGLVVCGSSCEAAETLLAEVERRLRIDPRPVPEPRYGELRDVVNDQDWLLPASMEVHALATDRITRGILAGGILYPCQAIFLSASTPSLTESEGLDQQSFRIIGSSGVAVSKKISRAEQEMLSCLARVLQRIEDGAPVRYLTGPELSSVLGQNAESYRQSAEIACH